MIDKTAGLPTQIRQLEKRLKEMDASKVKPALVKEITDTIKNLKDMLKEKQDKREQRAKAKSEKAQEVEAAPLGAAPAIGATAPNAVPATMPGQPEATPTTPDDQKISCPLCGGMTFNDQAAYQQHMEFTHASDVMPTTPGQKLDKTVAAVDPVVNKVETDPKIAPGIIVPDSVKKHDEVVDRVENDPKVAPHLISEQGPQFKLDDKVKPIRGGESTGKVMRWDGKPNDLVYVMWESGPLADRDTFGGYYPHDLKADAPPAPVEAAMPEQEPVCDKCVAMQEKHGDLKTNYEALLKDLKEERDIHYTQGNNAWVARLDQKIVDLENAIAEKFPSEPSINHFGPNDVRHANGDVSKKADGGPELIRQINKATSGHGYEATVYDLTNGRFQQNVPLKINDTNVRMKQPENGTFELKYSGMPEWRPVLQPEFDQWLAQWKEINQKNNQKEGAAENAKDLTIMDHTPPRANSGPDAGGTDSHDEFQDEWAMPAGIELQSKLPPKKQRELDQLVQQAVYGYQINVMDMSKVYQAGEAAFISGQDVAAAVRAFLDNMVAAGKATKTASLEAMKLNVLKRELLATPSTEGYDISHEGKKLFNIKGKDNKPMTQQQLEFCAQIEFTRGMKQAKLVEKIASLEVGSTVFIMAHDKTSRRVKFASLEHGFRGWAPASKFAYLIKEGEMRKHQDHIDNTFGHNGKQMLVDCPNGSGNMVWVPLNELLPINPPPATPESLNDIDSSKGFPPSHFSRPEAKERADQFGLIDIEDHDLTPEGLAAKKREMIEGHDIEASRPVWRTCKKCGKDFCTSVYKDYCSEECHKNAGSPKEAAKECPDCHGTFQGAEGETCPTCGRFAVQKEAAPKQSRNDVVPITVNIGIPREFAAWRAIIEEDLSDYLGDMANEFAVDNFYEDSAYMADLRGRTAQGSTDKQALEPAFPKAILPQRGDVDTNFGTPTFDPMKGPSDEDVQQKAWELFKQHWNGLSSEQMDEVYRALGVTSSLKVNADNKIMVHCKDCKKTFYTSPDSGIEKCPDCNKKVDAEYKDKGVGEFECFECSKRFVSEGKLNEHKDSSKHKSPKKASINKVARVVHREDGWHVLSEKGKNLGGPYKSEAEAVKRLRQVEYFKHHASQRPFSKKADALTDHINDMKGRITETQDRLQTVPAVKTGSSSQDVTQEQALPNHYIVQFVQIYDSYGPDAFCFLKATYDLAPQLEDNGFILDIDGPSVSGDQVANAENMDHGDVNEELAFRLERKWPVFLAKISKIPDPLTPEMREQLQGEIAVGHEDELKQELTKAQQNVDQLRQQLGELGVSAKVKALLKKKALTKTAARPDPDEPEESEESDLMDSFVELSNGSFALVQSHDEGGMIEVDILGRTENGYKYVTDSPIPVPVSAVKRILEWDEIQALKIEHEPWPTATPEVKQADQVTDETITTNDPNAIIDPTNPLSPAQAVAPAPTIQNVQPTDDDNLEVPVQAPTSPPAPGQKWVFDTQFNKYVSMPDPAAPGKTI